MEKHRDGNRAWQREWENGSQALVQRANNLTTVWWFYFMHSGTSLIGSCYKFIIVSMEGTDQWTNEFNRRTFCLVFSNDTDKKERPGKWEDAQTAIRTRKYSGIKFHGDVYCSIIPFPFNSKNFVQFYVNISFIIRSPSETQTNACVHHFANICDSGCGK